MNRLINSCRMREVEGLEHVDQGLGEGGGKEITWKTQM